MRCRPTRAASLCGATGRRTGRLYWAVRPEGVTRAAASALAGWRRGTPAKPRSSDARTARHGGWRDLRSASSARSIPTRLAEQLSGSEDGLARQDERGVQVFLRFDDGALDSFDGFLAGLHVEIRETGGLEAGWLGKGAGTVVRLAACLALLAWSGRAAIDGPPGHVGRQEVEDAVALWAGYFRPHARAVFNRALPATDRERRARRVARWLADTGRAEVSRQEIRCEALGDTANAAEADQVIARLSKAGILRLHVILSSSSGGRPTRRWLVNPALREEADG